MPRMSKYGEYVHQLSNGRWVVAEWIEELNEYQAPMTRLEQHLTGCNTYTARRIDNLGCTSYATRASAMNRARRVFADDV